MPVRYNLSSVWVRLGMFSQLSIIQYVGLCVFSLPISFVMIERIYILCLIIIIKSEVWTTTHCLGLGHETMVCAVCLSIFLSRWRKPFCAFQQYTKDKTPTIYGIPGLYSGLSVSTCNITLSKTGHSFLRMKIKFLSIWHSGCAINLIANLIKPYYKTEHVNWVWWKRETLEGNNASLIIRYQWICLIKVVPFLKWYRVYML